MKRNLYHSLKVLTVGLGVGVLTRLTDVLPTGLFQIQSLATLFGFWIVSVVVVILFSSSAKKACLQVFLYLFGMTLSFYFSKFLLGLYFPQFQGPFQWNLFCLYGLLSIVCAGLSYGLWFWNKDGRLGSILRGLPIGGLLAETIGVGIYLGLHHTYLFQLLFDLASLVLLGRYFFQKSTSKHLYLLTIGVIAAVGYGLVYAPFLLIP